MNEDDDTLLSKIVLWIILFGPWLTLLFMKRESIKRYIPVGILASLLMAVYNVIAYNQKHWIIKVNIIPWLKPLFVPGVFGLFIISTIWVFYFTFRRFWLYLAANIVLDFMFAVFPIHYLFQDILGVYQLVNMTPWGRYCIFVSYAIVLYCYQVWLEEIFKATVKEDRSEYDISNKLKNWFGTKEKVR